MGVLPRPASLRPLKERQTINVKLDYLWFWAFLVVFARVGALIAVAPVFGSRGVPVMVRIGLSAVLALALAPLMQKAIGAPPNELVALGLRIAYEVLAGLVMGYVVSVLVSAAEMAGEWLDVQVGYSVMQVLNPLTAFPSSLLAQFHYMMALVLFTLVDGHPLLLIGLARSFELQASLGDPLQLARAGLLGITSLITQMMMLALQIAAPAGGVMLVVDSALAAVSRAVPQVPVWLVGAPAKIVIGLVALGVSLPILVWAAMRISDLGARTLLEIGRMF